MAPRTSVEVASPIARRRVPAGSEALLEISWSSRRSTPWSRAGAVVAIQQLPVTRAPEVPLEQVATGSTSIGVAAPDPSLWDPERWRPTIFRALTDNDGIRIGWMRGLVGELGRWVDQQGLDRCEWVEEPSRRRRRGDDVVTTSKGELRAPGVAAPVRVTRRVTETPGGWVHVEVDLVVPDELVDPPRVGIEWRLPGELEQLDWYGDGPHECYPDRRASARLGRWSTTVSETYVDYVLPQEHGHRTGLRWLALSPTRSRRGSATGLVVAADERSGTSLGFSARHLSDEQLRTARHTSDLVPSTEVTHLHLDAAQRGLGTGSCGPDALERYRIPAGRHRIGVWVAAFDPRGVEVADLLAVTPPPTSS